MITSGTVTMDLTNLQLAVEVGLISLPLRLNNPSIVKVVDAMLGGTLISNYITE